MDIKQELIKYKLTKEDRDILIESYNLYETYKPLYPFMKFPLAYEFFYLGIEEIGYKMIEDYSIHSLEEYLKHVYNDENMNKTAMVVFSYIKKNPKLNNKIFQLYLKEYLDKCPQFPSGNCEKMKKCYFYLRMEKTDKGIEFKIPLK